MGLLLHPNKDNPKRYRVWDKALKIQKYYPLTPAGKKLAKQYLKEINAEKKRIAAEQKLDVNILFDENGHIKGMKRKHRIRQGRNSYDCFSLYAKKQQTEIIINDNFNACYKKAFEWLLDKHKLTITPQIKRKYNLARKHYKQPD